MKISVLTENCAGSHFQAEHGLSYLIEIDGEKILFDTGHSDVFLNNAQKMDINIHSVVKAILGGFHLKEKDEQTEKTIEYFQKNQVKKIYPSHCTQLPALSAFYEAFNTQQLKTGMVLEF